MSSYLPDLPKRRVWTKQVHDARFLENEALALKIEAERAGYRVTMLQCICVDWDRGPHVRIVGHLKTRARAVAYAPGAAGAAG